MTMHYPIVFETETSGAISAYVPGLPVYAAADTQREAETAIRDLLAAYLEAHAGDAVRPTATVKVAKVTPKHAAFDLALVSTAALMGRQSSARKASASRANGLLGGRPAKRARARSQK